MTIKIELHPEVENRLAAEAQAHGLQSEEYAQRLLQAAVGSMQMRRTRAKQEEFRAFLDALAGRAPMSRSFAQRPFLAR